MTLQRTLRPLLTLEGLRMVLVLTRDGLPIEMLGHGLRAEVLAAEVAAVAEAARNCYRTLGLGMPRHHRVTLEEHEVVTVALENHYLALVLGIPSSPEVLPFLYQNTLQPLEVALGGRS